MRPIWAQTLTGALLVAAVIGLALLPGRVFAPSGGPDTRGLSLPEQSQSAPVQAAPATPAAPHVVVHRVPRRQAAAPARTAAQLASAPVATTTSAAVAAAPRTAAPAAPARGAHAPAKPATRV